MTGSTKEGPVKRLKALLISGVFGLIALTATGCVTNAPVADPGMVHAGNTFYAASTTGQVYAAADNDYVNGWHGIGPLLNSTPSWAVPGQGYWAPQMYYYPAIGKWVAYYAAVNASSRNGYRCIGYAIGDTVHNFVDQGNPLCAPNDAYSVIDPSIFQDPANGQYWMTYKDDIPAGTGTKRIMIRPAASNGRWTGSSTPILTPTQGWETNKWSSVEEPDIVYHYGDGPGGDYYLFYSGNLYNTDRYGVGVARADSPTGPYTKYSGNPLLSGNYAGAGFCGVGSADLTDNGQVMWYSTYRSQSGESCTGSRVLAVDAVSWSNGWPHVNNGTPSG